jgi:phenylalanyl-tRNA synthetase alpha chain
MTNSIIQQIPELKQAFQSAMNRVESKHNLEEIRIQYAGRKGLVSQLFKKLGDLDAEDRKYAGQLLNELKEFISANIIEKESSLTRQVETQKIDVSLPGEPQ